MDTHELTNILYVEQSAENRKFNINDIKGNIDLNPLTGEILDPKKDGFGNLIDQDGKLINEIGYRVDVSGNIIDGKTEKILFKKEDLTPEGDIPAIFKIESNNFSIFDVLGDLEFDQAGKVILPEEGELKDK